MKLSNIYAADIAIMRCHAPFSPECTQVVQKILLQQSMENIIPFLTGKENLGNLILFLRQWSLLCLDSLPDTLIAGAISESIRQANAFKVIQAIIDHYDPHGDHTKNTSMPS
jgi:hypothetical protein